MQTRSIAALLFLALLAPQLAHADLTETERDESTRHAWGSFFGQTGAAVGSSIAVAVFAAQDWGSDDTAIPVIGLVPLISLGMSALGYAAEEGRWDPHVGWTLAGLYPGALAGAAFGLASALLEGQSALGAQAEATLLGAAVGAMLGGLGLFAESLDEGHPSALFSGFYGGFGTGLAAGMLVYATSDSPEAQAAPLLASAVGGLLGIVVTEAVRQVTE